VAAKNDQPNVINLKMANEMYAKNRKLSTFNMAYTQKPKFYTGIQLRKPKIEEFSGMRVCCAI
jgi:hypothetical protein